MIYTSKDRKRKYSNITIVDAKGHAHHFSCVKQAASKLDVTIAAIYNSVTRDGLCRGCKVIFN